MLICKYLILFNLVTELLLNCKFYLKFKNKTRITLINMMLITSLYAYFTKNKLLLMLYGIYNYVQIEGRLVALTEFKLPFFFKLYNYLGCFFNVTNIFFILN